MSDGLRKEGDDLSKESDDLRRSVTRSMATKTPRKRRSRGAN
jgi:hypothetical protein